MTKLELAILTAIANSEYSDGNLTCSIWTFSVWDNVDRSDCPNRKSLSGGISSLVKKEFVQVWGSGNDATIRMTDAGAAAYTVATQTPQIPGSSITNPHGHQGSVY